MEAEVKPVSVRVADIVECTEAEGPGLRFALWVQGCPLNCPGCCNPEYLPFDGGREVAIDDLFRQIEIARSERGIEGVTFLGGEPLVQADAVAELAACIRSANLSVMVFSGYTLDRIRSMPNTSARLLLDNTDILVDGPYLREKPDTRRRWIGSTNQRIHFLTDRYRADDPVWQQPNTLEIRLTAEGLSVNGFPASGFRPLWRRPLPIAS